MQPITPLEAAAMLGSICAMIWFGGWVFANMRAAGIRKHYGESTGDIAG